MNHDPIAATLQSLGKQAGIDILFDNISLLDTLIEPKVVEIFKAKGNKELI